MASRAERMEQQAEQQYAAVAQQTKVKPAFTVKRLNGMVDHTVHRFDKANNKIVSKVEQRPAGYLVKFAKGHSIRAIDDAHLKQIGAGLRMIPLVDTESGEVKGFVDNSALEDA